MIEIDGVSKLFPGKRNSEPVLALKDVNLTVHDNEFLTILGPVGLRQDDVCCA